MAEGVLRSKLISKKLNDLITVDSAGTISMHEGEHPDSRAIKTAKRYGVDISKLRARPFTVSDFDFFEMIIVMDDSNYSNVISMARDEEDEKKVTMLLNYSHPKSNASLQDPYFGGMEGFDTVFKHIDVACDAIIRSLEKEVTQ